MHPPGGSPSGLFMFQEVLSCIPSISTRHGQTVWNVENKICGVTDSPLTDLGRSQARALGRQLADNGHGITHILCSPLSRAHETARSLPPRPACP